MSSATRPFNKLLFWQGDLRQTRIIRFVVGVTLTVALAFAIEWSLSFLTPVLTAMILAKPIPGPSPRALLNNIMYVVGAFALGTIYTFVFLPFPMVYLIMLALALFHIYYQLNRGGPFMLVLMNLLAILILPTLTMLHDAVALGFSNGFILSGVLFMLAVFLSHQLIPDPPCAPALPAKPGLKQGYSAAAAQAALKSTLIVWPVAVLFITMEWKDQMLVLVYIAIFSLSPELTKGREAGINSLISAFTGGLFALLYYSILLVVPEFYFLVVLTAVTSLIFAQGIFSTRAVAKYFPSAFTTLLFLISYSMSGDTSFTSNFFFRLLYIGMATVYVVFTLRLLDSLWPEKQAATCRQ